MNYKYVAYDEQKRLIKGKMEVASATVAEQMLLRRGYQPVTITEAITMPPIEEALPSLFKVKLKEVVMFSRQLATLIDAGISIVPALQLIQEQTGNRLLKKTINELLKDLRSGNSFSQALSRHEKIFSDLYCQLVAVGERTGNASDSLRQAALYMEKDDVMRKKIKKALTYPAIVAGVAVVVMAVLMTFVLPSLMEMFSNMNTELPITTRLLIDCTDFASTHALELFVGMGVVAGAGIMYVRRPSGRYKLDQLLLKAPVIGKANLMGEMARFSRTLALLVHAGLPLPEILQMAQQTSTNLVIKEALVQVRTELLQGEGLAAPMARNKLFPPLLVQMVSVGEESGRLESTLETVATSYEVEADETIGNMVSMIEPVMTIVLAIGVGFIALSVITPMYTMTGAFE